MINSFVEIQKRNEIELSENKNCDKNYEVKI